MFTTCGHCHKEAAVGTNLLRCARCHGTYYCNTTCQKAHHGQHKTICMHYSQQFQHCFNCDSTINVKSCHTCYTTSVCDRDDCIMKHEQTKTCVTPENITEASVIVDITKGEDGMLSIACFDGVVYTPTMKNLVTMLMSMDAISMLSDRVVLVYFTFGGLVQRQEPGVECTGPILGVSFENKSKLSVCADGMYRTPISKINITAGAGGPRFNMEDMLAPLEEGINLVKMARVVVPLSHTTQAPTPGANG
ncbi:hypothetical protein T484DRAFT_1751699 [Baffinella frigidus]|nr:hypothetical protein T484DRAFT_1751699 [Cryptophyta sp. CCMP2293]